MKTLMVCFVNSFPKELPLPTFPMMIYSILLISSIIVLVNALAFLLPSKCFINFFVDFVALDLTIYLILQYSLKRKSLAFSFVSKTHMIGFHIDKYIGLNRIKIDFTSLSNTSNLYNKLNKYLRAHVTNVLFPNLHSIFSPSSIFK